MWQLIDPNGIAVAVFTTAKAAMAYKRRNGWHDCKVVRQ